MLMVLSVVTIVAIGVFVLVSIESSEHASRERERISEEVQRDQARQRKAQIVACEDRGNLIRRNLHEFERAAAENRAEQAKVTAGREREKNLDAAEDYRRLADQMYEIDCQMAVDHPTAPARRKPLSVKP